MLLLSVFEGLAGLISVVAMLFLFAIIVRLFTAPKESIQDFKDLKKPVAQAIKNRFAPEPEPEPGATKENFKDMMQKKMYADKVFEWQQSNPGKTISLDQL